MYHFETVSTDKQNNLSTETVAFSSWWNKHIFPGWDICIPSIVSNNFNRNFKWVRLSITDFNQNCMKSFKNIQAKCNFNFQQWFFVFLFIYFFLCVCSKEQGFTARSKDLLRTASYKYSVEKHFILSGLSTKINSPAWTVVGSWEYLWLRKWWTLKYTKDKKDY